MNTIKTLAHVWASEAEAQAAQSQVDAAENLPKEGTTHYQSIQFQEDIGWWMMADGVTGSVLGTGSLAIIDEQVDADI
jgi:hypothetical protein